ncbi:MAG: Transcriptional regulator, IclR [Homoserinimonas sp.]|nr:Transcriptional regulator, IclR [Homoserinimonas sp.]
MSTEPAASGYRESNSTAERALTILGMFSDEALTVSAADVASTLGVARSTAYRYLQSLVSGSFLEEAPSGGFRLGLRVLELARLARRGYGLSEAVLPVMKDLAERFHQTVLLTRRVGDSIVCIEREEGVGQYVRLSYERGTRLPINAGASALVLLAWLPEDEARTLLIRTPLQAFTENTVTEVDGVMTRLADIRKSGYALSQGEVDPDVVGIGAPIFGADGQVVAGLSIVALQRRLPQAEQQDVVAALIGAAQAASQTLTIAG